MDDFEGTAAHAAQSGQNEDFWVNGREPQRRSGGGVKTFFIAFAGALAACIIAFAGFGVYNHFFGASKGASSSSVTIGSSGTSISVEGDDITLAEAVAQKALPSVVAIDVYTKESSSGSGMSYYGFGYGYGNRGNSNGGETTLTLSSLGSGVVLSDDGYIITNEHVVSGADALIVTIGDEEYEAEVIGSDASSDVAVIKAKDASGLTAIAVGDSDSIRIGEWVMTIGSPFGLEQSVATGVVSATSRSQVLASESYGSSGEAVIYENLIQTDAAINPGNSGGALVNSNGELIGINTLITSYSGNYSGVGFAIPVNYAVELAEQIIAGKTPTHAQLGVSLYSVTASVAQRYNLAVKEGAYVTSLMAGSGAEKAGVQVGDIITEFDGKKITSSSDLMLAVRACNPGDTVSLSLNRNGKTMEVEVELGEDTSSAASSQGSSSSLLGDLFNQH